MRVLITNDDGIDSPGLAVLANVAHAAGHEVVVAAPAHEYSGASASLIGQQSDGRLELTHGSPPGLVGDVEAFGVRAAPALIAFAASYGAFGERPDLLLSGINLGANTGHATLHSGTVGAALSAVTQGIPALAASIASAEPVHWDTAQGVCRVALEWLTDHLPGTDAYLLEHGWATASLLSPPTHDTSAPGPPEFTTEAAQGEDEVVEVSRGRTMSSAPQTPAD